MDRGVIVGGGLIAASFLGAVLLNWSADQESAVAGPPVPVSVRCESTPTGPAPSAAARVAGDAECEASASAASPQDIPPGAHASQKAPAAP